MKKIIGGKMYNTETAKFLGMDCNHRSITDFYYFSESLFVKKTGEYFLLGEGGAASQYASRVDSNCWGSGRKIIPLTVDEAREWAENHLDADEYEAIFGPVEE